MNLIYFIFSDNLPEMSEKEGNQESGGNKKPIAKTRLGTFLLPYAIFLFAYLRVVNRGKKQSNIRLLRDRLNGFVGGVVHLFT